VNHFDADRQHLVNAIPDDRVRLPAADLHDLPWLRGNLADFARHPLRDLAIPKLGQVLHWLGKTPVSGAPGPDFRTWETAELNQMGAPSSPRLCFCG
jgi:hypothetical protein